MNGWILTVVVGLFLTSCASTSNDKVESIEKTFLKIQLDAGEQTILDTEVLCDGAQKLRFGEQVSEQAYIYRNFLARFVSGALMINNASLDDCAVSVSLDAELYADVSTSKIVNGAHVYQGDYLQNISQPATPVMFEQGRWQNFVADGFVLSIQTEVHKVPL